MVSVASSPATMDLTVVLPALMEGLAQEVGVGMGDLKVILVGTRPSLMLNLSRLSASNITRLNVTTRSIDQLHNPEPYVEICLKQDAPLLQPYSTSQTSLAFDVKGSERWTHGDRPIDLYQVGSYGSCLSALRSRLICAMEGALTVKVPSRPVQ